MSMKSFLLSILMLFSCVAFAQDEALVDAVTSGPNQSNKVEVTVVSLSVAASKEKVAQFVKSNNVQVIRNVESLSSLTLSAKLSADQVKLFEAMLPSLGKIQYKEQTVSARDEQMKSLKLEEQHLAEKKASYVKMSSKIDSTSETFVSTWQELNAINDQIYENQKQLLELAKQSDGYVLNLTLEEESTMPESTSTSFVNMPGFQYSQLFIENPKQGLSFDRYQGYFLKYLFTRGKSFLYTGAYKNIGSRKGDDAAYSEMFVFGIGQDFYSRYLGQGHNRFFNLYSGYNLGYVYATGEASKSHFFYAAPTIGLEIFKNKYMLFDTKVSYFLPFSHTKNLRGLSADVSVNFLF